MISTSLVSSVILEAAVFALYMFICIVLVKHRFSRVCRVSVYAGVLLCSLGGTAALALSGNVMAALTLLPLTVYLPFSICVYLLSEGGIFETGAACSMGAMAAVTVKLADKVLGQLFADFSGTWTNMAAAAAAAVLASAVGLAVFKLLREPFKESIGAVSKNRALILIPAAALFLLVFINFNSAKSTAVLILTLVIAASYFAIASSVFVYSARIAKADETEKKLAQSLELQRKGFELLSEGLDTGRLYRHDMRHHLSVLSGMAKQNHSDEIVDYIENLNEKAAIAAPENYCKNPAVNAVLSEHISRAKKMECRTELKISMPPELPFDLPDVCIILSNALENALNACEKCPEGERWVKLLADFSEDCKLKISVINPCADEVKLDGDGLPVIETKREGHGIGLCGVKKTVQKYNGFVYCVCENGEFHFCAEIFHTPGDEKKKQKAYEQPKTHSKVLTAGITVIVCAIGLVNFFPTVASALSEVLSVEVKTISYGWGDNGLSVRYPQFGGDNADVLNQSAKDFVAEAQGIFREYALQKYEGYTAVDAGYRVYVNDRFYLSARFFGTLNAGGSMEFSRCVTIDKKSGEAVELGDLFEEGRDYISEISAEIVKEMEFRNEYMGGSYFLPGGIWGEEECFKEISEGQEFYINSYGLLVIVFDEYTVAAGSEGAPEFVMPEGIFKHGGIDYPDEK